MYIQWINDTYNASSKDQLFDARLPSWGWDMYYASKYVRIRIPKKAEGWLRLFYPKICQLVLKTYLWMCRWLLLSWCSSNCHTRPACRCKSLHFLTPPALGDFALSVKDSREAWWGRRRGSTACGGRKPRRTFRHARQVFYFQVVFKIAARCQASK